MVKKTPKVGVIAEDESDVESITVLIHRIANNDRIGVKGRVGRGCGKLRRKCHAWAKELSQGGCSLLILVHDLDNNDLRDLRKEIGDNLNPCPITIYLICIPIQELEAWLLSDPEAIKTAMHLKRTPNVKGPPETINSPKEHLADLIDRASDKEKIYMNTKHNYQIAASISIDLTRHKCNSFVPFYDFVQAYLLT
ncbi:MAG: DUF4276 family protein [Nitrososphaeria archaeon]|jgi:hypothetical protein